MEMERGNGNMEMEMKVQMRKSKVGNGNGNVSRENVSTELLLHNLEMFSQQPESAKPWKWLLFEKCTFSMVRHRKWVLLKKSTFRMVCNDEKYTFWKVLIFDGAAENRKMKSRGTESRRSVFLQNTKNHVLPHGSTFSCFSGFQKNIFRIFAPLAGGAGEGSAPPIYYRVLRGTEGIN